MENSIEGFFSYISSNYVVGDTFCSNLRERIIRLGDRKLVMLNKMWGLKINNNATPIYAHALMQLKAYTQTKGIYDDWFSDRFKNLEMMAEVRLNNDRASRKQ